MDQTTRLKQQKHNRALFYVSKKPTLKNTATPKCVHKNYPHIFLASGPKKTRGVLIAVHKSVSFQLHGQVADLLGRYLIIICSINNALFTLATIYAPYN